MATGNKQELDLPEFEEKDYDLTCEICAAEFKTANKKDLHMERKHIKHVDGGALITDTVNIKPKAGKKKSNKYKNKA